MASLVAIPVQAYDGNLVVNGDFETPVVPPELAWQIYDSGTTGLGWTVEWVYSYPWPFPSPYPPAPPIAKLELQRGLLGPSYDGSQNAELDTDWGYYPSEPASVRIYQEFATVAGGFYTLEYAWSPRPGWVNNILEVWWEGILVGYHSSVGYTSTQWSLESILVVASTSLTRIDFVEVGFPDTQGMLLDAVSVILDHIEVDIDIKPGSDPNSLNPDAQGLLPVAIFGSDTLDVEQIELGSILLGDAKLASRGSSKAPKPAYSLEDVDVDGYIDLVAFFAIQDLGLGVGDNLLTLDANLLDGTPIVGSDSVRTVPPGVT